jgi:hypothetical protein
MEFFGLTADVLQLAAGQKIHASATFDLGTTGAGGGNTAGGLTLGICYSQVSSGGSVVTLPTAEGHFLGDIDGGLALTLPGGARMTYSVAKTLDTTSPLANGDKYTVGLCGCVDGASADAANWSPGFGLLTVQVFQPAL